MIMLLAKKWNQDLFFFQSAGIYAYIYQPASISIFQFKVNVWFSLLHRTIRFYLEYNRNPSTIHGFILFSIITTKCGFFSEMVFQQLVLCIRAHLHMIYTYGYMHNTKNKVLHLLLKINIICRKFTNLNLFSYILSEWNNPQTPYKYLKSNYKTFWQL